MNSGVAIRYGDVAPGAKESFVPGVNDAMSFVDLTQLQQYNLVVENYGNPCEAYQTALDGSAELFPDAPEDESMGLWSDQLSGDNGVFATAIQLTLTAAGQYTSQGFTFTFDTHNNIYPRDAYVAWYRNGQTIDSADFSITSAFFFFQRKVENFDKVVFEFYNLNMPKNRLKIRAIDYGYGTFFYGDELRNVKLIQELDPISAEIAINTCDFTLDSKRDMDYSFQAKQPLSVYFNGELRATTFVKSSKRKSKSLWEIQSEDYIGMLDVVPFVGGMYVDVPAAEILTAVFATAKVPCNIDAELESINLTGHIAYTSCREALMQIAFAAGAVVDTSNSDVVKVYFLSDDITQTIPLNRILQGQSFIDDETVTGVELSAHIYTPSEEKTYAYKASENGTGEGICVVFSEPLHTIEISNGEIIESGTNYAVINAEANCQLWGQKYEHNITVYRQNNPVVLASEMENVISITAATLISTSNVKTILQKCFDYLTKVNTVNLKIIEGKHVTGGEYYRYGQTKYGTVKYGAKSEKIVTYDQSVNVGDIIESETEYLGTIVGRSLKQTFALNGGIIIKETELK